MKTIYDYIQFIKEQSVLREEVAMNHYEAGKRDCQAGYYDKWYRYKSSDDGFAYDLGWNEQNKITQNGTVEFLEFSLWQK